MLLQFTKVVATNHLSMGIVFILEGHLQPCFLYIKCVSQIYLFVAYCYIKEALAVIHFSDTAIILESHLQ